MIESKLRERIESGDATVAVIGCGYVGLPLSQAFADAGFQVVGIDSDAKRVAGLNAGKSHILDVPADRIRANRDRSRFRATTEYAELADVDVIFISVPTPSDRTRQPDLSFIIAAANGVAAHLRAGQLVILESTTYPGTTDEVLKPILEKTGLVAGQDFFLAFSPERIDPGNRTFDIHNTPKVVGGVDPVSTELAVAALRKIITEGTIHAVGSARAAELTKLLENTYRAVNIAFVNELAKLCDRMHIDIWEVIEAAATKPFGFVPFYPGPGVGGHCIPVDPYYLAWKAREYDFNTRFIELAADTNLSMPFFVAARIERLLNDHGRPTRDAKVLVLGATFKPDIDDARNSPAIRVMEILRNAGARVEYHDPYAERIEVGRALYGEDDSRDGLASVPLDPKRVGAADLVAVLVGHRGVDYGLVLANAKLVFDAVNVTKGRRASNLERL